MGNSQSIELYELLLDRLLEDIDAHEWHVDGEPVELDELSARDGFLPLFGSIAASHAIAAGMITSFEEFPIAFEPADDCMFGLDSSVSEQTHEQMLPHAAAQLFLIDAVHYTVSLNDRDTLSAMRRVDLHPAIVELEMSHEHHAPQPTV